MNPKIISPLFITLLLTLPIVAHAASAQLERRSVTQKETDSFKTFYLKRYLATDDFKPEFSATRFHGEKEWTVTAAIFGPAEKGYKDLCHAERYHYIHTGKHAKGNAWKEDEYFGKEGKDQAVWIGDSAGCGKRVQPVVLRTALPDVDVFDILEHNKAILNKSVSLISGYTGCYWINTGNLKLAEIGTGSDLPNKEVMYHLTYAGEDGSRASLLLRRTDRDFTPWSAKCPMPP